MFSLMTNFVDTGPLAGRKAVAENVASLPRRRRHLAPVPGARRAMLRERV